MKENKPKRKRLLIIGAIIVICLIIGVVVWLNSSKNASNSSINTTNQSQSSQASQTKLTVTTNNIISIGASDCVIPDKVLMTDFLGYSLTSLIAKYGGISQLNSAYVPQVIVCEDNNYYIRITSTAADQIANYIEIQEKEFGYCNAGIDNVKPWVDKSMLAVGLDPTTKGSPTYDTGDNRSQIKYSSYMVGDKKTFLTIECNITGDWIGVITVLDR